MPSNFASFPAQINALLIHFGGTGKFADEFKTRSKPVLPDIAG